MFSGVSVPSGTFFHALSNASLLLFPDVPVLDADHVLLPVENDEN